MLKPSIYFVFISLVNIPNFHSCACCMKKISACLKLHEIKEFESRVLCIGRWPFGLLTKNIVRVLYLDHSVDFETSALKHSTWQPENTVSNYKNSIWNMKAQYTLTLVVFVYFVVSFSEGLSCSFIFVQFFTEKMRPPDLAGRFLCAAMFISGSVVMEPLLLCDVTMVDGRHDNLCCRQ